jgi:hypothetical protein
MTVLHADWKVIGTGIFSAALYAGLHVKKHLLVVYPLHSLMLALSRMNTREFSGTISPLPQAVKRTPLNAFFIAQSSKI